MLEQVKAFNQKHDGMPVKVAGAVLGAVIVGAAAFAVYNYSTATVITMEPELIEEVVESTAKAAGGSKAA